MVRSEWLRTSESAGDGTGDRDVAPLRIVVCSDGTGNVAAKNRGTNVFKLYEGLSFAGDRRPSEADPSSSEPGGRVIAIYDDGVGTQSLKWIRWIGAAFGFGFRRNVCQLYAEICRVWEPGAELWFFGFSRGAFTVRTLCGLINRCGLARGPGAGTSSITAQAEASPASGRWKGARARARSDLDWEARAFRAYAASRSVKRAILQPIWDILAVWRWKWPSLDEWRVEWARSGSEMGRRRDEDARDSDDPEFVTPEIHFIGVWDTVDAVGFPVVGVANAWNAIVYSFRFPDRKLPANIRCARHALSLDDERRTFWPELWEHPHPSDHLTAEERLDQEAQGVESSAVGAPKSAQSLKQVWFAGVHSNVGGGYPKQGMSDVALYWMLCEAQAKGLPLRPSFLDEVRERSNVRDELYDSRGGLAVYYRFAPRRPSSLVGHGYIPVLHYSVLDRVMDQPRGYAPGAWPKHMIFDGDEAREVPSPVLSGEWDAAPQPIKDIAERLGGYHHPGDTVSGLATARQVVQWIAIPATVLGLVFVGRRVVNADGQASESTLDWSALDWLGWFLTRGETLAVLVVLLLSWLAGWWLKGKMVRRLRAFWEPYRRELRKERARGTLEVLKTGTSRDERGGS